MWCDAERRNHDAERRATVYREITINDHRSRAKDELMGKMLETLKLGESRRPALTVTPSEPEAPGEESGVDWKIGDEVPFVEVGGPSRALESSPGLIEHPPQAAQPP